MDVGIKKRQNPLYLSCNHKKGVLSMSILTINHLLDHTQNKYLTEITNIINPLNTDTSINNYTTIVENIDKTIRELALTAMKNYFEKMDEDFFNSRNRKASYYVKNKRSRTLISVFGKFEYTRRTYECKSTGKYYTHVDRKLGLPKYDKYDPIVKAQVIELAANSNSMIKVGQIIGEKIYSSFTRNPNRKNYNISRQTVHNILKKINRFNPSINRKDTTPSILYIMADEKYINLQRSKKKKLMLKHIVSFEGIEHDSNRAVLKNKLIYSSHEQDIWVDFHNHLAKVYDLEKIRNIVIMGDGASWIKSGIQELVGAEFVLDKFHTYQAIENMTKVAQLNYALRQSIHKNDITTFNEVYNILNILEKENESRLEIIKEKSNYIKRHWRAIQGAHNPKIPGCSMEGHISHNLASIFSSRPKAYTEKNLIKYANLRNLFLNNVDILNVYLDTLHFEKEDNVLEIKKEVLDFSMFASKTSYDKSSTSNWVKGLISKN